MFTSIATSIHGVTIRARTAAVMASFAILLVIAVPGASGQATYTADRTNGFSVFGAATKLNTDYGSKDNGYTFGGDFSHAIRFHAILPSLELRYTGSTGPSITEDSIAGGLKLETKFHRFHPYGDVMVGYGIINYVQVNSNDNSITYGGGLGLDFDVTKQFALKVDAQEQFWHLGQGSGTLTPQMISFGLVYRFPSSFRRHR